MSKLIKSSYYFPLQVTIDDREPATLEGEFQKIGNMIISRQRLMTGDYLFDRDFLVERKTIPDFCQSIKDGRLFKQVKNLTNCQVPACLILEGKNQQFKKTDFSPQAIQSIQLSISLAFRLPILKTKNFHETVRLMLKCYIQLTKYRVKNFMFNPRTSVFKKKSNPLLAQRIHILEGFPGIGTDRAERLLKKFGNLHAVFTAEDADFLKLPGFGKKTVDQLRDVLNKKN
ncbi:ERCC4 domain-containing protein [uncultured Cyclobacterium sp.]|uniref:ERCC4 domain-containing protein n=1 Tax=uncultured Cyclobacterium sp. TaxID=453820 RepID=UPI0030EBF735|tara:strand:+ start:30928 stop:31614 length:687 start_codon:yes stop_codon:yes gene_type:complete